MSQDQKHQASSPNRRGREQDPQPKAHESSPDQKPANKKELSDLTKQVTDNDLHK